jgi:hypothetical protein
MFLTNADTPELKNKLPGEDCTAGSRLYVQDTIYDKFMGILIEKVKQTVIGDGFDEKSAGGPVVRMTIMNFIHRLGLLIRNILLFRFQRLSTIGCGAILNPASERVRSR